MPLSAEVRGLYLSWEGLQKKRDCLEYKHFFLLIFAIFHYFLCSSHLHNTIIYLHIYTTV